MTNTKKSFLSFIVSAVMIVPGVFFFAGDASAAILSANSAQQKYAVGDSLVVTVSLNTQNEAINAVEAYIQFPPDLLEIKGLETGGSFIELWINKPNYSNEQGLVSFIGGLPTPGFNGNNGFIGRIVFKAKRSGRAQVTVANTSRILLNDGFGTAASLSNQSIILTLTRQTTSLPVTPIEAAEELPEPSTVSVDAEEVSLSLKCSSHPDQDAWYSSKNISCLLQSISGAQFSYIIDNMEMTEPDPDKMINLYSPAFQHTIKDDGIWYLHIKAKFGDKWSQTVHRSFKIDSTPPEFISLKDGYSDIMEDGKYFIAFNVQDALSGILAYAVKEKGGDYVEAESPFMLRNQAAGFYQVFVKAVDYAGNETIQRHIFRIKGPLSSNELIVLAVAVIAIIAILVAFGGIIAYLWLFLLHKRKKE